MSGSLLCRCLAALLTVGLVACATEPEAPAPTTAVEAAPQETVSSISRRLADYALVTLSADLSHLTPRQRQMIPYLIEAAEIMDRLFWKQAYGDKQALLASIQDADARRFAEINYGPWDRLNGDRPFVPGVDEKPPGAAFYPVDMTREEFEAADLPDKRDWYTLLGRNSSGALTVIPYHVIYQQELARAARLLGQAAALSDEPEFKRYLTLRARSLITDDYLASDMAWMEMKQNDMDIVIGPIEQYEDKLFGYKTAFEAYVLLKDLGWSRRLARFAQFLPDLQAGLPVAEHYKSEVPGTDSDLNAYDVIYYAGHSNAGSKTIAINLPNDERVQLEKGTRRLQLKNAMRAKFDKIMVPITQEMIAEDQRDNVTFDAFFATTMFHEVAHGLGPKHTVDGGDTVRNALRDHQSAMEEGKADILGLYMITWLYDRGELPDADLIDYYVTFLATTFRSIRFGTASAHAKADMVRFNFFKSYDAVTRHPDTGLYRVHMDRMREAMDALSAQLVILQGNGDYEGAGRLIEDMGIVTPQLQADLASLEAAGIPVDVVFEQGVEVLGLR